MLRMNLPGFYHSLLNNKFHFASRMYLWTKEDKYYQLIKEEITPTFLRNNRIDFQVDKYLARLGVTK